MNCCKNGELDIIKEYEPKPKNADGSIHFFLYRWDDGKDGVRRLVKCRKCGKLYLVQAYHLNKFSEYVDVTYEDYYAVSDEKEADFINRTMTGTELEKKRKASFSLKRSDFMNIQALETAMWQAAKSGDKFTFLQLVSADAVMVCGGYRCTGAEYAEFISDFGISDFEITDFEIVLETENIVQVHYIVRTTADSPENADMAGKFHLTSTWRNFGGEWQLVFNMDSRIVEG